MLSTKEKRLIQNGIYHRQNLRAISSIMGIQRYLFEEKKEIRTKLKLKLNFFPLPTTDTRLSHLPFMGSPLPMIILVSVYLYIIRNGKKWMEHRKPMEIERLMVVYNIVQIIVNSALFLVVSSLCCIHWHCVEFYSAMFWPTYTHTLANTNTIWHGNNILVKIKRN